jgi:hypothetical protein
MTGFFGRISSSQFFSIDIQFNPSTNAPAGGRALLEIG